MMDWDVGPEAEALCEENWKERKHYSDTQFYPPLNGGKNAAEHTRTLPFHFICHSAVGEKINCLFEDI